MSHASMKIRAEAAEAERDALKEALIRLLNLKDAEGGALSAFKESKDRAWNTARLLVRKEK